jgi:hypothetical protein
MWVTVNVGERAKESSKGGGVWGWREGGGMGWASDGTKRNSERKQAREGGWDFPRLSLRKIY